MKIGRIVTLPFLLILCLASCATAYREIHPSRLDFISGKSSDRIALQYKYDVLRGKYARNESRSGIKVVALKITNSTNRDLVLGKDVILTYVNGRPVKVLSAEESFDGLKQHPASYLWYLLLTPLNLYTTEYDSRGYVEYSNAFPIGLVLGPGLSIGNMVAAGSANRRFKSELTEYGLLGSTIKKGETAFGLITIESPSFDALKLHMVL